MKIRLLRVDEGPAVFAPLVEAIRGEGLRCGWLDLTNSVEPPTDLETAAGLGVLRAVSAVGERVVSVKPVKGAFVLRDLLREHFRGCDLVLVRGEVEAARLRAVDGSWKVVGSGGEEALSTDKFVAHLRKPGWPPS